MVIYVDDIVITTTVVVKIMTPCEIVIPGKSRNHEITASVSYHLAARAITTTRHVGTMDVNLDFNPRSQHDPDNHAPLKKTTAGAFM